MGTRSKAVAPAIKALSVCQSVGIFRKLMEFGLSSNALILCQMSGSLTSRPSHSTNCHPPLQKVECAGVGNLMTNEPALPARSNETAMGTTAVKNSSITGHLLLELKHLRTNAWICIDYHLLKEQVVPARSAWALWMFLLLAMSPRRLWAVNCS